MYLFKVLIGEKVPKSGRQKFDPIAHESFCGNCNHGITSYKTRNRGEYYYDENQGSGDVLQLFSGHF
jgi:hypothetical protein